MGGEMDYVWGDNKNMIDSSTIPESKFSDILTKNWSYQSSYRELIQPVFHHAGNTAALFLDDTLELDVAIEEGSIFGIQVGSEKRSSVPMSEGGGQAARVCGTAYTITEEIE